MWFSAAPRRWPPVVLLILDGWGEESAWGGNAITAASTPTFTRLYRSAFHTTLEAAGAAVGLPGHEQGNSEVGHLTIGAGRAIEQDQTRIAAAIADGSFFRNATLQSAFARAKQRKRRVHVVGLMSTGGVHSHLDHLHALLELARLEGVTELVIHAITDGRDVLPHAAAQELDRVRHWCSELGTGRIGSVVGRSYAMDRDNHWERIERAYRLLVRGEGLTAPSVLAAISHGYSAGLTDEFLEPTVIEGAFSPIEAGDTVIMMNFRQDRARQLLQAFVEPQLPAFLRGEPLADLTVVTMIPYWVDRELPGVRVAFTPEPATDTLGSALAAANLRQLRVAETEKYAHVTYFLNGGREAPYPLEERTVIPSKLNQSPNHAPAMKTLEIGRVVVRALQRERYGCIVANIASPDMVGHTGDFAATVTACEVVDQALTSVWQAAQQAGAVLIVTADHGNAEQLVNPLTNEADTHHTTSPVPFIVADPTGRFTASSAAEQSLADVAPTVLTVLGVPVPPAMRGRSLGTMGTA